MFVLCVIVTVLLALVSFSSAMGKLRRVPQLVEIIDSVGFGEHVRTLAFVQLLGVGGLLVGLVWAPVGIAASAGLAFYYVGAMVTHAAAQHPIAEVLVPFPLVVLSLAAMVLRMLTI